MAITATQSVETRDRVVIRFAGDSGDGMQITGQQFTNTSAHAGNDLATFPDFPAEIRAPAGTLAGVSGFQVHFASNKIFTAGDDLDVLVAMNPAALKVHIKDLQKNGILIVNTSEFGKRNLEKAGYEATPLEDGSLDGYQVFPVDLTDMTQKTLADSGLNKKTIARCKNMFALGMMYFMYSRPLDHTLKWFATKFGKKPEIVEANTRVLQAGYSFAETTDMFATRYEVPAADLAPGLYRNINGNAALALGFVAAAKRAETDLFLGSYPITPASTILHELSRQKNFGIRTFQAEDEIAAVCSAIGAAFGGSIALTSTSGPGLALKGEAIGLAIITELPLVVINVQRGGPSTGLPTKTEQADLLQCLFGRNSEAPMPVLAAATPSDCFDVAIEAVRVATKYMTPVLLMTDGAVATASEPWRIPAAADLPEINIKYASNEDFLPYARDPETLARGWALPGTPGLEHRIGGLEKEDLTGNVSYDPANHEKMCKLRAKKVAGIARDIPPQEVFGSESGKLLVLGWGGTYGALRVAVTKCRSFGWDVSHAHLRWLNPMPADLGDILDRFEHVLIPELNLGQLNFVIRGRYLREVISYPKIQGQPFKVSELVAKIGEVLGKNSPEVN